MKLSDFTLQVLENFTNINDGIVILKDNLSGSGTQIRTLHVSGSGIMASVVVPEKFANDICIADLKPFLNVVKITKEPNLEFEAKQVLISGTNLTTAITYARQTEVIHEYSKTPRPKGDIVTFSLSDENLTKILKLADTLQLDMIKVEVENGNIVMSAFFNQNPDAKNVRVVIGKAVDLELANKVLPLKFPRNVFKFIQGTYEVEVCAGLARFTNAEMKLDYTITPSNI